MSNSAGNFQPDASFRPRGGGTGTIHQGSRGWVGGRDMVFRPHDAQQPIVAQQPQPPQVIPQQVQSDIDMGGAWGAPPTMPQMNPFSMYGGQQSPFNWGNFFNMFGGK